MVPINPLAAVELRCVGKQYLFAAQFSTSTLKMGEYIEYIGKISA
jgi:hypothetical protein